MAKKTKIPPCGARSVTPVLMTIAPVMLGAATTGAIIMASGATLSAPHGGIFVFFAISKLALFLLALVVGTLVGGAAVVAAKQIGQRPAAALAR